MTDVKHWVYDLETLINCFIGVFEDYASNTQKIFVIHPLKNDIVDLMIFLKECKKNKQVWYFGYNNIGFDSQIIEHLLRNEKELLKKTPDEITSFIYSYTQSIINKSHKGEWADYPEWKLSIKQVDIYKLNHWDSDAKRTSLKWTQFGIDWDNVEEMPYHHSQNIEGWEQLKKVIKYCINDVRSTKAIFLDKDMKKQINLRSTLSKIYGINLQSASEPKISKEIFAHFLSEKLKIPKNILKNMRTFRDNIDVSTLILPYIKFSTPDFQKMYNWFSTLSFNPNTTSDEKGPNHVMLYKNVETVYALGGIHGCAKAGVYDTDDHTTIVTADVTSFYPIMAIKNKWSPSHLDRDHFSELYQWFFDERIKYDKSDPLN